MRIFHKLASKNIFGKLINFTMMITMVISLSACSDPTNIIVSDVNQKNANAIIFLLANNNIPVTSKVNKSGTITLAVSKSNMIDALRLLKNNGLPNQDFVSLGDVFKKDSLISSPLEEHNRDIYAIDQEIASMLSHLNGVTDVQVKVAVPAPNDKLWDVDMPKPSASVVIKYKQGTRLDLYVSKIKSLVAHSVGGLSPDMVEVVTVQEKAS